MTIIKTLNVFESTSFEKVTILVPILLGLTVIVVDRDQLSLSNDTLETRKLEYEVDTVPPLLHQAVSVNLRFVSPFLTRMMPSLDLKLSDEERYRALLKNVETAAVFEKSAVKVWECRNCGHVVVGTKAPDICPVCAYPQSYFEIQEKNY